MKGRVMTLIVVDKKSECCGRNGNEKKSPGEFWHVAVLPVILSFYFTDEEHVPEVIESIELALEMLKEDKKWDYVVCNELFQPKVMLVLESCGADTLPVIVHKRNGNVCANCFWDKGKKALHLYEWTCMNKIAEALDEMLVPCGKTPSPLCINEMEFENSEIRRRAAA